MQRLADCEGWAPMTGKLRPGQIATRTTWAAVPDAQTQMAAAHIIHVTPSNGSTVTALNPLDPATAGDAAPGGDTYLGWLERPGAPGTLRRSGWPRV